MQHSEQINELAAALAKAQGEMSTAKKNTKNPFLKSEYADLASVWEAARDVLSNNGLAVMQPAEIVDGEVVVTTMLTHESGQWLASSLSMTPEDERGKSTAQVIGSIISYLRRYGLMSAVGVTAEGDDDDGNAGRGRVRRRQQQQPTEPPQQARADNGNGHDARPYTPEQLRARIQQIASANPNAPTLTDDQRGGLIASLKDATGGDTTEAVDQNRNLLLEHLLGHNSSTDVTGPEAHALRKWLNSQKNDDGEWQIDETAQVEAKAVIRQAQKAAGQQEMEL